MTYLTISFAAPGLGVFPYLISLSFAVRPSSVAVLLLSMAANFAVGTMLVLMAYSVAYYGVLTPDRVVKHDLFHYLLRGPVVGILVIVVMLVIPRVELDPGPAARYGFDLCCGRCYRNRPIDRESGQALDRPLAVQPGPRGNHPGSRHWSGAC